MQTIKNTTIAAALVSSALVAPLLYLELRHGSNHFPYDLFALLWLVPATSVFVATPPIRAIRAGESVLARPVALIARIGFLIVAALFWTALVNDQMPCFLGVPNCD